MNKSLHIKKVFISLLNKTTININVMKTILENLKINLTQMINELDRREKVYSWGVEDWKRKNTGGVRYNEDNQILRDSISELKETVSNLELLIPIN